MASVNYSNDWRIRSFLGVDHKYYENDKVNVWICVSDGKWRAQLMECPAITPKGQQLYSEVKYFETEKETKAYADEFIARAEAKPLVKKESRLPRFAYRKTGNLVGL